MVGVRAARPACSCGRAFGRAINTPNLIFSQPMTSTPEHKEDLLGGAVNKNLAGAPKAWSVLKAPHGPAYIKLIEDAGLMGAARDKQLLRPGIYKAGAFIRPYLSAFPLSRRHVQAYIRFLNPHHFNHFLYYFTYCKISLS
jgi:hypothetical protein